MISGWSFRKTKRQPPEGKLDAPGYEWITVAVYGLCGMVIHKAESEDDAITQFWAEYHQMSINNKPWIELQIDGKAHPRLGPCSSAASHSSETSTDGC